MNFSKSFWNAIIGAVLLFSVHASADYLLQGYQHHWATWLDLHGRAVEWPWYLDMLPRDLWHGVQSIRNHTSIAATLLSAVAVALFVVANDVKSWQAWTLLVLLPEALYGLTRAVFFSLVKALLN